MMDKISLIIPCKNEVESLGAVLEEVKDNKFVNEIIVVVDGEQENLIEEMVNGGNCAPITDYFSYANRLWVLGSGDMNITYGSCSECDPNAVYGCTDPNALNYDPNAT